MIKNKIMNKKSPAVYKFGVLLFLFYFSISASVSAQYSIFVDTSSINTSTMNLGAYFTVNIKFDGGDTQIQSLTTCLEWDSSAIKYIKHTDNLQWDLSAAVYNSNPNYPSHNPAAGIFFWDYAGLDTVYTGVQSAHTITFQLLQRKKIDFNIIMGDVIWGGFSGSGLTSISSMPGRFLGAIQYANGSIIPDTITADVVVFPNPFVPNDGNPNTGDYATGIHFRGTLLNGEYKIEIYTLLGELVWEIAGIGPQSSVRWDGRNRAGREVASGVYFALVKGSGQNVVKKIAIIR